MLFSWSKSVLWSAVAHSPVLGSLAEASGRRVPRGVDVPTARVPCGVDVPTARVDLAAKPGVDVVDRGPTYRLAVTGLTTGYRKRRGHPVDFSPS